MHQQQTQQANRGVALITAILVVALATTAAVAMMSRQQLDIRRTANMLEAEQILLYTLGVEDWAGQMLRQDKADSETDHSGEDWATVLPPIPVEGGHIAGYVNDLQGRFNLNNLINNGEVDSLALGRFRRLLSALELEPDLATAVVDWLDPDIDAGFPDGAEDGVYLGRELPHRTANQAMASPTELLLVAGFSAEVYKTLAPYVATLPFGAAINLNTAEEPVLRSLAEGITAGDAEALIGARGDDGFESVDAFIQENILSGRQVDKAGLGVSSDHFMVTSSIQVGRGRLGMQSLLARAADGETKTIFRSQAQEYITKPY